MTGAITANMVLRWSTALSVSLIQTDNIYSHSQSLEAILNHQVCMDSGRKLERELTVTGEGHADSAQRDCSQPALVLNPDFGVFWSTTNLL